MKCSLNSTAQYDPELAPYLCAYDAEEHAHTPREYMSDMDAGGMSCHHVSIENEFPPFDPAYRLGELTDQSCGCVVEAARIDVGGSESHCSHRCKHCRGFGFNGEICICSIVWAFEDPDEGSCLDAEDWIP